MREGFGRLESFGEPGRHQYAIEGGADKFVKNVCWEIKTFGARDSMEKVRKEGPARTP